MSYTAEEEFYGRAAYEGHADAYLPWANLPGSSREPYIKAALKARAAAYVDPVQEVANKLYAAVNGRPARGDGNAWGDYLKAARAAIAMGAKP